MELARYFDPAALALVGFGCLAIALIQNGIGGVATGFAGLPRLFRRPADGEEARLAALVVEDIVARRGVGCADRGPQHCSFTRAIGELMSDTRGYDSFAMAVDRLIETHKAKRARAINVWNDIADAAPALGMLGTVLGLVEMFGRMDSAQGIGAAMALCLLTSLYGLVFAHLVAGPIARRMQLLGAQDALWQEDVGTRLLAVARREYPEHRLDGPVVGIWSAMPQASGTHAR